MNERVKKKRKEKKNRRPERGRTRNGFLSMGPVHPVSLKAGLVSARVIHFSTLIRIWTSNRLDHSYQFVLLHCPSVIPPLALCNLSKTMGIENELANEAVYNNKIKKIFQHYMKNYRNIKNYINI